MTILKDLRFTLSVDHILSAQDSNPDVVRKRTPQLIKIAEKALAEAMELISPIVIYQILNVVSFSNQAVHLEDGNELQGEFVNSHLARAEKIAVVAVTISDPLEKRVSELLYSDPVYAHSLNAAGFSAVERLSVSSEKYIKMHVIPRDKKATMSLSPGMIGWPLANGQRQIFNTISKISNLIRLSETQAMVPAFSLSYVMGIGSHVNIEGNTCEFCSRKESCFYQNTKSDFETELV